jgi:hypothetical protein
MEIVASPAAISPAAPGLGREPEDLVGGPMAVFARGGKSLEMTP